MNHKTNLQRKEVSSMPPRTIGHRGMGPRGKIEKGTDKRLLKYVFKK